MIPAAGMGARLGRSCPKALVDLAGKPLLARTLERFSGAGLLEGAVIIVPDEARRDFEEALSAHFPGNAFTLVAGGPERQDSVENGLRALGPDIEMVVIHDAARPFIGLESIRASLEAAAEYGAATVAIPSVDTVLVGDEGRFLTETPDRSRLWACQTPQTFRVEVIREAHAHARKHGFSGTDDATLVRWAGGRVKLVMGTPLNFKVTTPTDLELAAHVVERGLA